MGFISRIIDGLSGENERVNCQHCGRPFTRWKYGSGNFCAGCQKEYRRGCKRLSGLTGETTTRPCSNCDGSGKIKGYKCVQCNGWGSFMVLTESSFKEINEQYAMFESEWKGHTVYDGDLPRPRC